MLLYFRLAPFASLKNCGFGSCKADLVAGLTVDVAALPLLAMAFAIAPEKSRRFTNSCRRSSCFPATHQTRH